MIAFFRTVIAFFLSFAQIFMVFSALPTGGKNALFYEWSSENEFSSEYVIELEKQPGKDFVVLNLTDVQLQDIEAYGDFGELAEKTIDKLVESVKPDLITMTGDNAWSSLAYMKLVEKLNSYGIPWAPVMGNHDGEGLPSELWAALLFTKAENCIFSFGPKDMGYGNYIINIKENGEIVHSIFMMDTHASASFTTADGQRVSGYDHLWDNQIEWYKWAVKGIERIAGKQVESSVFMHIPVVEFAEAWEAAGYDEATGTYLNPDYADSFGVNHERVCCAPVNNGFFDVCKELGSTKNIICGHDHINSSSIVYEGIRLTYSLKCGAGCYWEKDMSGGTKLSISSDGAMATEHIYINPDAINISSSVC